MTWFETEQIYRYLGRLEEALEQWALSRYQMQSIQTELKRLTGKLNHEIQDNVPLSQKELLLGLCDQIQQCQVCIDERLKY